MFRKEKLLLLEQPYIVRTSDHIANSVLYLVLYVYDIIYTVGRPICVRVSRPAGGVYIFPGPPTLCPPNCVL